MQHLTMNRFRVNVGHEEAFEEMWASRDSHLKEVPGFVAFRLMKGEVEDGARLYASHTVWESREHFLAWTKSEAFRKAHAGARPSMDMYQGPPVLEVFDTVLSLD